ncbi:MAG: flagellar protein FlbD [Elusimicrobia bacterium]|nr:MAG: flagellar protein FlbD [Elusimicrobiota bacterium]
MIELTRLNGKKFTINAEIIETLEETPGSTILALATNNHYNVKETVEEITGKVIEYRRKVNADRKVIDPIAGFERT